jgi:hypothetical protein
MPGIARTVRGSTISTATPGSTGTSCPFGLSEKYTNGRSMPWSAPHSSSCSTRFVTSPWRSAANMPAWKRATASATVATPRRSAGSHTRLLVWPTIRRVRGPRLA